MPKVTAAVVVAALLAGGCTTWDLGTQWTRPNTMMTQMTYDNMECGRLDEEVKRTPETILGGIFDVGMLTVSEIMRISRYNDCMSSKGYVKSGYMKL